MVRPEAGRNTHRTFETKPEQAGPSQQHEYQGSLRHDEAMAQNLSGAAAASSSTLRLKRITQRASKIKPGDWRRQNGAHNNGCGQGGQGQPRIEGDAASQGQAAGAQHGQEADTAGADGEPEQSSGQRQHGGLDYHFAYDVSPACAERLPDGQFLDPATGADQKQVHKVDRAD